MKKTDTAPGFLRDLSIVTALVYICAWLVAKYLMEHSLPLSFAIAFGVLVITTYFVHRYLVRANRKRPQIFVAGFMGALGAKLFLSILILVVAGLLEAEHFKFTALAYLVGYFALSAVEIRSLLPLVRKNES